MVRSVTAIPAFGTALCPNLLSFAVINTVTESDLEKKDLFSLHVPIVVHD